MEMSYVSFYFSSKVHTVCHSRHSCDPFLSLVLKCNCCVRIWISPCNEKCLKQEELVHICAVPRRHLNPSVLVAYYKVCQI